MKKRAIACVPAFLYRWAMTEKTPIKSPCISVCTVDGLSGYCLGCFRTLNEIATWTGMDDAARDAVMGLRETREAEQREKRAAWLARQKPGQKAS